jgi:hypothetical protein
MKRNEHILALYENIDCIADHDANEFDHTFNEFVDIAQQCDAITELSFVYDCDTMLFTFDPTLFDAIRSADPNEHTELMLEYLELIDNDLDEQTAIATAYTTCLQNIKQMLHEPDIQKQPLIGLIEHEINVFQSIPELNCS